MTVAEFFTHLQSANLAPLRTNLLQRIVLTAEARAKFYASGNAPGPNVRTGTFRRSLSGRVVDSYHGALGTTVRYGPFLEAGTVHMRPRPSLGPGIADAKADVPALWRQAAGAWLRGLAA